jgi:erythromycin esterase
MRRERRPLSGAGLLGLALVACGSGAQEMATPPRVLEPRPRLPLSASIVAGEVHVYEMALEAGQLLRAEVSQLGTDVVVTVVGPDGSAIIEVDDRSGELGAELVEVPAATAGPHRLHIRPKDLAPSDVGRYSLWVKQVLSPEEHAYVTGRRRAEEEAVQWISDRVVRLATAEAGNGFADMQPLKAVVGDARVVALGEATHGTREFFQLKHRMLEFLVTEMGFTVFAIEATMPQSFDVNRYVLTGEGDPAAALAGLGFWTWSTEEVLEQIEWMRHYNADPAHERKVKFYGFDMQSLPRAVRVPLDYLADVDPAAATELSATLAPLATPMTARTILSQSAAFRSRVAGAVQDMLRILDVRRLEYVARTDSETWAVARRHAEIAAQNRAMSAGDPAVRDSAMAENALWILEHEGPETKMVVWAHNGHVATFPWMMGGHLRRALGPEMVVFGFAFNQGSFRARDGSSLAGPFTYSVGPAKPGTLDAALAEADIGLGALDLRRIPSSGSVAEWWASPRETRMIGAVYSENMASGFYSGAVIPTLYDVLLFVDSTTGSRPLGGVSTPRESLSGPSHLDFEAGTPGEAPPGWFRGLAIESPYATSDASLRSFAIEIVTSAERAFEGTRSAMISRPGPGLYGEVLGVLGQRVNARPWRARRLRLRAAVRVELQDDAKAYLWVSRPGSPVEMVAVTTEARDWREYELVTGILSEDTNEVAYGLALEGLGRAWIDAVSVDVVSLP